MAKTSPPKASPKSDLRCIFSNEGSAAKAYAKEATELHDLWSDEKKPFVKIGAGACGEVYQQSGKDHCMDIAKRAKTEEYALQLWDDYQTHLRVVDSLSRRKGVLELDVLVPQARDFVAANDRAWWKESGNKFPSPGDKLPEVALLAERVMPIPVEARNALIALFCPENRQEAARADPRNLDCLVRLYLGKQRPERRARSTVSIFGLRNFQLYINDMEKIGLDTMAYAVSMARALALMHWEVKCDANDVEFIIGGARPDLSDRAVELWLIDFNRVRPITMNTKGIEVATEAFMVNDRYYPRPLDKTDTGERHWVVFKEAYLEASKRLQRAQKAEGKVVDWDGLPEKFIEAVVEAQAKLLREKVVAMDRE